MKTTVLNPLDTFEALLRRVSDNGNYATREELELMCQCAAEMTARAGVKSNPDQKRNAPKGTGIIVSPSYIQSLCNMTNTHTRTRRSIIDITGFIQENLKKQGHGNNR